MHTYTHTHTGLIHRHGCRPLNAPQLCVDTSVSLSILSHMYPQMCDDISSCIYIYIYISG